MASAEIAPLTKHMTPTFFYYYYLRQEDYNIMQLRVEKYHYSWNIGEFIFYLTKPKFKPLKMSFG